MKFVHSLLNLLFIYFFNCGCVGSSLQRAGPQLRCACFSCCGARTSLAVVQGLSGYADSLGVARGLNCPVACGILVP